MKILSLSTSSNIATVAISEDDNCIKELNIDIPKTHSETLVPLSDELLKDTNIKLCDINLIACDVGPRFFYWNKNWNFNSKSYCTIFEYTSCRCFITRSFSI